MPANNRGVRVRLKRNAPFCCVTRSVVRASSPSHRAWTMACWGLGRGRPGSGWWSTSRPRRLRRTPECPCPRRRRRGCTPHRSWPVLALRGRRGDTPARHTRPRRPAPHRCPRRCWSPATRRLPCRCTGCRSGWTSRTRCRTGRSGRPRWASWLDLLLWDHEGLPAVPPRPIQRRLRGPRNQRALPQAQRGLEARRCQSRSHQPPNAQFKNSGCCLT